MKAVTVNEQLIAYRHRTAGGGPCVVFANSLGTDQGLWDDVISDLGGGFDTLTHDLRGHGLSAVSQGYTVVDMADDLIALLEYLGLSDVILCGVSGVPRANYALKLARTTLAKKKSETHD